MIRRFLLAWRIAQGFPYDERYEDENFPWTQEDANWLLTVFRSPVGIKFRQRLKNHANSINASAIQTRSDQANATGFARGVTHLVAVIESHLPQQFPHAAAHSSTSETMDEQGQSMDLAQLVP